MTDTSRKAVLQNLERQAVVNRDAYLLGGYNPALTDALNRAIAMLEADKREIEATERQVEVLSDELSKCRKAQQVAVPATDGEIYTAYITATNQTLRPQDERLALKFARAIEAHHKIGAKP